MKPTKNSYFVSDIVARGDERRGSMLVQFTGANGERLCCRHAVLAVTLRVEKVRASVGEDSEMGYVCCDCEREEEEKAVNGYPNGRIEELELIRRSRATSA